MRLILCALMLCGAAIAVQPVFQTARVVALWSDFEAFKGKVAALENGNAALLMGGESDSERFDDLLRKLWALRNDPLPTALGVVVFLLAALGLGLDISRGRGLNTKVLSKTG
jgi:hypothetical protein